ncbi:alcohol dehydrogenase [Gracilibacillus thailandensis]|uniref:Alcohol dehydrogenase n=1 Tax=Gracilibacillus thailandensis TaxID=563735 RepID=A0A6N7QT61_9BACI|nr:alcohol dehydrogenase [Gracilibacillus thailandensis]
MAIKIGFKNILSSSKEDSCCSVEIEEVQPNQDEEQKEHNNDDAKSENQNCC